MINLGMRLKDFWQKKVPRLFFWGSLLFPLTLVNPPIIQNGYKFVTLFLFPLAILFILINKNFYASKDRLKELFYFISPFLPWVTSIFLLLIIHRQSGFSGYFLTTAAICSLFLILNTQKISREFILSAVLFSVIVLSISLCIRIYFGGESSEYFGINRNWLMGGFCLLFTLVLTMFLDKEKLTKVQFVLLCSASILGLVCLAVSQVRTTLIGICAIFPILLIFSKRKNPALFIALLFCVIALLIYFGMTGRISAGFHDIYAFKQGDSDSSLGIRLELWSLAINAFLEKPFAGWGPEALRILVENTNLGIKIPKSVSLGTHFHNDLFNTMAIGGLIGLVGWGITIVWMFKRSLNEKYLMSLLLCMLFIGLSDCFWTNCRPVFILFLTLWLLLSLSSTALPSKSH